MRAAKSESIRGVGFFKENYISGNVTDLNETKSKIEFVSDSFYCFNKFFSKFFA